MLRMTTQPLRLSVLDLIPVRTNQTTADAVAATVALARRADELGFERYWLAEHHNMPSVASTNPPVLIGIIAGKTERIRVGSGGVMLPNHAPLVVAEQFAALEAAYPGRIDLGLGRAPGSDPVITAVLRHSGATSDVDMFPDNIRDIQTLLHPEGAALQHGVRPRVRTEGHTAGRQRARTLAARLQRLLGPPGRRLGLPYVFAHHFSGQGTERALELYRDGFTPSEALAEPRTFLTVNAAVAPSADEAYALALPQLQHMARLRTGQQLTAIDTIEDAATAVMTPQQQEGIQNMRGRWIIDEPAAAAARIRDLAERFGVDEVMISPAASASAGDDPASAPGRLKTLELLAAALRS